MGVELNDYIASLTTWERKLQSAEIVRNMQLQSDLDDYVAQCARAPPLEPAPLPNARRARRVSRAARSTRASLSSLSLFGILSVMCPNRVDARAVVDIPTWRHEADSLVPLDPFVAPPSRDPFAPSDPHGPLQPPTLYTNAPSPHDPQYLLHDMSRAKGVHFASPLPMGQENANSIRWRHGE